MIKRERHRGRAGGGAGFELAGKAIAQSHLNVTTMPLHGQILGDVWRKFAFGRGLVAWGGDTGALKRAPGAVVGVAVVCDAHAPGAIAGGGGPAKKAPRARK